MKIKNCFFNLKANFISVMLFVLISNSKVTLALANGNDQFSKKEIL
jgi:hypothetical protein